MISKFPPLGVWVQNEKPEITEIFNFGFINFGFFSNECGSVF